MQCNCLEETRKRLSDAIEKQEGFKPRYIECQNSALTFNDGQMRTTLLWTIKGGEAAPKKYRTQKGVTTSMLTPFCPMCGKPAVKEKGDEPQADQQ